MELNLYNKYEERIAIFEESIVPRIGEFVELPVLDGHMVSYEKCKVTNVSYVPYNKKCWSEINVTLDTDLTYSMINEFI